MLKITDDILSLHEQRFIEEMLLNNSDWTFSRRKEYEKNYQMHVIHVMRHSEIYNPNVAMPLMLLLARYMGSQHPDKTYNLHKINVNGQYKQNISTWHTDVDYSPDHINLIYYVNTDWDPVEDGGNFLTRNESVEIRPGRFIEVRCGDEHMGSAPLSDKFRISVAWTFGIK